MTIRNTIMSGGAEDVIPTYIDDVYNANTYIGNGSSQVVTTNVDLTKGGMVLLKQRTSQDGGLPQPATPVNFLVSDTARFSGGVYGVLSTNRTDAQRTSSDLAISAVSSTGFTATAFANYGTNTLWVSHVFRKAPKFFDVTTFTTNGSGTATFSHALGQSPGMVIFKRVSGTDSVGWITWHRSLTANHALIMNTTAAQSNQGLAWCTPTASDCTMAALEASAQYVAYVFAHDTTTDGLIQCGSYTGNGTTEGPQVPLNWEPQTVWVKQSSGIGDWFIWDSVRGMDINGNGEYVRPNLSNGAGSSSGLAIRPNSTGFKAGNDANTNANGATYIYLAIRRSNKPPTVGTQVFAPVTYANELTDKKLVTNFQVDMYMLALRALGTEQTIALFDRLRGQTPYLGTSSNGSEATFLTTSQAPLQDYTNGIALQSIYYNQFNESRLLLAFRRAVGVFDYVCYSGSPGTVNHSLGVKPELAIFKSTNLATTPWKVFHKDVSNVGHFNDSVSFSTYAGYNSFNFSSATSTSITLSNPTNELNNGYKYVVYLFATRAGISKVGSYTGNGTNQTINCGFTTGARFVLIKRTDSTGDWYFWDTSRGIIAGNDPHLSINTTVLEVTSDDTIDPDTSGFVVNQVAATNVNVNTSTYIYLALA